MRTRTTAVVSVLILILAAMGASLGAALPAAAHVPPVAAAPFEAPACPGETVSTPSRQIDGAALAAYNQGRVIAMYDSWGVSTIPGDNGSSVPPLCGVRYLTEANGGPPGGGPVSAWMFCSDADRDVCNDGTPLDPADDGPRMSEFSQRVFAHLVQNGHSFVPADPPYPFVEEVTVGRSDGSSDERVALQYLLWCVSDYGTTDGQRFSDFCDANGLDPASVAADYAFLLEAVTPQLRLASFALVEIGTAVEVTLITTIVNSPLTMTVTGGTVQLCPGEDGATLTGASCGWRREPGRWSRSGCA